MVYDNVKVDQAVMWPRTDENYRKYTYRRVCILLSQKSHSQLGSTS